MSLSNMLTSLIMSAIIFVNETLITYGRLQDDICLIIDACCGNGHMFVENATPWEPIELFFYGMHDTNAEKVQNNKMG